MTKKKTVFRKRPISPKRAMLIQQLRHALHLAESAQEEIIEFDILETTFDVEVGINPIK